MRKRRGSVPRLKFWSLANLLAAILAANLSRPLTMDHTRWATHLRAPSEDSIASPGARNLRFSSSGRAAHLAASEAVTARSRELWPHWASGGPAEAAGPSEVTGPSDVTGPAELTGPAEVTGPSEVVGTAELAGPGLLAVARSAGATSPV